MILLELPTVQISSFSRSTYELDLLLISSFIYSSLDKKERNVEINIVKLSHYKMVANVQPSHISSIKKINK